MKIKIVGFKVGVSKPTANRTLDYLLGTVLAFVLAKSDFVSVRWVMK